MTLHPLNNLLRKAPKLELKTLQPHTFLGKGETLPVIIVSVLNMQLVECLVEVLKRFSRVIGWITADIIGIPPFICSHNPTQA